MKENPKVTSIQIYGKTDIDRKQQKPLLVKWLREQMTEGVIPIANLCASSRNPGKKGYETQSCIYRAHNNHTRMMF